MADGSVVSSLLVGFLCWNFIHSMRSFSHTQRAHSVCYLWKHKQIGCSVAFSDDVGLGCICWMNKAPQPTTKAMGWWRRFLSARQTIDALSSLFRLLLCYCLLSRWFPMWSRTRVREMNCFRNGTSTYGTVRATGRRNNKQNISWYWVYKIFWSTWMETTMMLRRYSTVRISTVVYMQLCFSDFDSGTATVVEWEGNYMCSKRRRWWWWCSRAFLSSVLCSVFDYEFNNSVQHNRWLERASQGVKFNYNLFICR